MPMPISPYFLKDWAFSKVTKASEMVSPLKTLKPSPSYNCR